MCPEVTTPALAYRPLTSLFDWVSDVLGYGRPFMRRVLAAARLTGSERVLDLGSGTGTLLSELVGASPPTLAIGLEPDAAALRMASLKLGREGRSVCLVRGIAQSLPFGDNSMDLVTSTLMFHHLSSEGKAATIGEAYRVLQPGGRFLLVDFGRPTTLLSSMLLGLGSLFDGRDRMRANVSGQLPELLRAAGFGVEEIAQPYRSVRFLLACKAED